MNKVTYIRGKRLTKEQVIQTFDLKAMLYLKGNHLRNDWLDYDRVGCPNDCYVKFSPRGQAPAFFIEYLAEEYLYLGLCDETDNMVVKASIPSRKLADFTTTKFAKLICDKAPELAVRLGIAE